MAMPAPDDTVAPKWTPGEWRVFSWPQNAGDDGAWCYGFEARGDKKTFAEHEANARLMTAALPLYKALAALTEILARGDGDPMSGDPSVSAIRKFAKLVKAVDAARAALALARGETK